MDATFLLTRGYTGLSKLKYLRLIRRNRSIARIGHLQRNDVKHLIFHEGNISRTDMIWIRKFSIVPIEFISIEADFKLRSEDVWTGNSEFPLGYSLMCRFNYLQVWSYLADYRVVCRLDEDCTLRALPNFDDIETLIVGALSDETHTQTNKTLPQHLEQLGLAGFYDHLFPYTNCYVTRVDFWKRTDVQNFLSEVGNHPEALENRWGDLPILGVALKAFGSWDAEAAVDPQIMYRHGSHSSQVAGGVIQAQGRPSIDNYTAIERR